jgi:hypothetical protein
MLELKIAPPITTMPSPALGEVGQSMPTPPFQRLGAIAEPLFFASAAICRHANQMPMNWKP